MAADSLFPLPLGSSGPRSDFARILGYTVMNGTRVLGPASARLRQIVISCPAGGARWVDMLQVCSEAALGISGCPGNSPSRGSSAVGCGAHVCFQLTADLE